MCVCVVAVRHVMYVFISAVCGVSYRYVCVGSGGLCSAGWGRGVCVAEVRGGGLMCWGLCVFVIKCVGKLWVFSVVVRLESGSGCVVWLG